MQPTLVREAFHRDGWVYEENTTQNPGEPREGGVSAMRSYLTALIRGLAATLAAAALATADDGGRPLLTTLTGAEEAPGPGDPDGIGSAVLRLNQGQREVCFAISWADIDGEVFAGHIHIAPPRLAGTDRGTPLHRLVRRY